MNEIMTGRGMKTHDAVHIEVKVIKLDTVWIWSGNVDGEFDGLAECIWNLDLVVFEDRHHWGDVG
jgi:hypothetical protein